MSSYAYTQELMNADESHTETTKLMSINASESNTLDSQQSMGTKSISKVALNENGTVEGMNGDVTKTNGIAKPENIEMSTSTMSIKCCNGMFQKKKNKIVKETQTNGNGKCYFDSLKEKIANGKTCKAEKVEKKKKLVEYENRDPFKVNSNIKYEFVNVFAEPNEGTYSFNPTWNFTNQMFFNVKLFIYRILSVLIGIPSAFICAIFFAVFSALQIWILQPFIRVFKSFFGIVRELWATIIDCVLGPIFQSYSHYRYSNTNCTSSSKSIYNDEVNVV